MTRQHEQLAATEVGLEQRVLRQEIDSDGQCIIAALAARESNRENLVLVEADQRAKNWKARCGGDRRDVAQSL